MNRRIWVKQMIIAGGAVLLLPACWNDKGAISITLKSVFITDREEQLLAELAEAIIPETESYGAKTLNLHQFLLKMIDDCYDKKQQEKYVSGLRKLDNYSKKTAGNSFLELGQEDKLNVLRNISKAKSGLDELKFFIMESRHWVIKGYDTSEYFMTRIIRYELVPGRFHGCVKVFPAF